MSGVPQVSFYLCMSGPRVPLVQANSLRCNFLGIIESIFCSDVLLFKFAPADIRAVAEPRGPAQSPRYLGRAASAKESSLQETRCYFRGCCSSGHHCRCHRVCDLSGCVICLSMAARPGC